MPTIDELKGRLKDVTTEAVKADGAGRNLVRSAMERRDQVDRQLSDLRPATLTSEAAARQYSDLIEERGRLDLVIGGG